MCDIVHATREKISILPLSGVFPSRNTGVWRKPAARICRRYKRNFFEAARIAEAKRPAYLLLENVPGLLLHDGGRTLDAIFSMLTELGYAIEWSVHNSANFGVPQQRRRLYIVANLGGRGAGRIFPLACGNAENLK